MISMNVAPAVWSVIVMARRDSGETIINAPFEMIASDAFDYAAQAVGYFRFAIQEMDCDSITIELYEAQRMIQSIAITRD